MDDHGRDVLDNRGGPDAFHYVFVDNVPPDNVPYDWIELRGDPAATWIGGLTHFTGITDGYSRQKLPIGFSFPFYGATYDCVRVATNGFLQFTTTATWLNNACLPSTLVAGPMIAVLWDDLHLLRGGRTDTVVVGYRSFGTHMVIEFDQIGFFSCPNAPLKFEAILYPNGNIKLQYNSIPIPTACANSQSIGIQQAGAAGSAALNYVCNTTGIQPADGRAILFSRPSGIPNPPASFTATYNSATGNVVLAWQDPTQDTEGNPITIDNVQVWVGAVGSGQLLATVARGVQTYTEVSPLNGPRFYYVRAYRNPYYGAAVSCSVMVGNLSYFNDFEQDDGGWVPDPPTGGWEWGTPTLPASLTPHSGTKVWGTVLNANYPNNACFKLTLTPNITVASPTATVEFWRWWSTEQSYDGVNFKVSTDQGATWTLVQPSGGYPYTSWSSTACIPSQPCWSGYTGGTWTQIVIPIGQFLGETPMFRFTFGSDGSSVYPGFFFDDMLIWGLATPNGVPRAVTNLAGNYVSPNVVLTWTDPTLDPVGNPVTLTNLQVWLGQAVTGQLLGTVNPGVQTYTHFNAPAGHQTYSVRAYANPNYGPAASVPITVGNPSYDNNFNSNDGGWVPDPPTGGWSWGVPTNPTAPAPYSAPSYWGTGLLANYDDAVDYKLDLNPGMEVQSPSAEVEFWFRYSCEANYDGCNFKASVDSGTTWTVLTPSEGAYTVTAISTSNTFMAGQPAWSGRTQSAWQPAVFPVGQYLGQIPIFRFEFSSDASVSGYMGFFFDDMIMWGLRPPSSITGTVRAFVTNLPIAGARVWATDWPDTVTTDDVGTYLLPLEAGTYTVSFRHVHFCDTSYSNVVVEAGSQTVRNVVMRAPHGQISVTSLTMETTQGENTEETFTISNSGGQCPLSFSISDTSGWLTVQPAESTITPNQTATIRVRATVAGMAVGDYASDVVVRYNAVGSPFNIRVDLFVGPSAVDLTAALPTEFAYYPNYPNPFNASTTFAFDVPQQSRVQVAVFNIVGQEVARPVDDVYVPGRYRVLYDASGLPSGMYLVKMTAAGYTKIGKMMLLK
jgi:hypothetical protein